MFRISTMSGVKRKEKIRGEKEGIKKKSMVKRKKKAGSRNKK